jgi:hypothetical protein
MMDNLLDVYPVILSFASKFGHRSANGQAHNSRLSGEIKLPTSLIYLQEDSRLPDFTSEDEDDNDGDGG